MTKTILFLFFSALFSSLSYCWGSSFGEDKGSVRVLEPRIIGGTVVTEDRFPYVAFIKANRQSTGPTIRYSICGASLVAVNILLVR